MLWCANFVGSCRWNEEEKKAFYEAYREHQKDFVAINKAVNIHSFIDIVLSLLDYTLTRRVLIRLGQSL